MFAIALNAAQLSQLRPSINYKIKNGFVNFVIRKNVKEPKFTNVLLTIGGVVHYVRGL
jgi:hypothetical protein